MLKVLITDSEVENDCGKVFFCDSVLIHETGNYRFCEIRNERAKVKSCQIPLNKSHFVSVVEDKQ